MAVLAVLAVLLVLFMWYYGTLATDNVNRVVSYSPHYACQQTAAF